MQDIRIGDHQEGLVDTETGTLEYRVTDCQLSNTASVQHLVLTGTNSAEVTS